MFEWNHFSLQANNCFKQGKQMGTFAIYAFVVTGIYIVYLSVVIMMDLFGKKGQKKSDVETFDTADIVSDEESPTVIVETEDGYSSHRPDELLPEGAQDEGYSDDDEQCREEQELPETIDQDDETLLENESEESTAEYMRVLQAQMESAVPSYQDEYVGDDFAVMLAQPMGHKNRILRTIVKC